MKAVLLGINASWTHSCLALYYLRNAIADLCNEVEIIELTLKQSISEALESVYNSKPDVLCLSVYIWNVEYLKQLVPEIRKLLPNVKILAGGPEISFNNMVAETISPDILVKGYGVKAFRALAENNFHSKEKVIQGEPIPLEQLPFPYLESDTEILKGRMVYYEASRGCACRCIYCLSSREEKQDWLPLERVFADISKLLSLQPKVIKFVDRSFNQKKQWARAIWQYVINLETDIPFHFEVHPDWLEAEDIEILKQAPKGRIQFEIGIQSIHTETLKHIQRPSDWNRVKANLIALKENTQIPLHTDLIVGLPGEDKLQVIESINAVILTSPTELQLGFLKILQGTDMADNAVRSGYLWTDFAPYTVLQTPGLPFAEIQHLEKVSRIVNQFYNKGDFTTVLESAFKLRAPFTCLEELLRLIPDSGEQLHSISRINRFEIMAKWISQAWSGEAQSFLGDALRWDWCRKASEAWYPDFILSERAMNFRKEHYTDIVDWLKQEYWQHEDWNFKRFTVFCASSFDFSRDYLGGSSYAIFVTAKGSENAVVFYSKEY